MDFRRASLLVGMARRQLFNWSCLPGSAYILISCDDAVCCEETQRLRGEEGGEGPARWYERPDPVGRAREILESLPANLDICQSCKVDVRRELGRLLRELWLSLPKMFSLDLLPT